VNNIFNLIKKFFRILPNYDSWLDREIVHDGKLFIYKGPDHPSIRDFLDMLEDSKVHLL
jgi:hypothetical protein